jgi:branched-chain amino acid transport system permease protein
MISLCQMSFAGVGAWIVAWLNVNDVPGSLLLWVVIGGLAAVPLGVAIGLPALRLRGISLAVATLGFAASLDVVLAATTFPGQTEYKFVPRPSIFESDERYFVFCVIVFTIVAVGLNLLSRTRLGAAWLAIRHSERAAAAHGVGVPAAKLSAFALSAFVAGVSGGLLAGQVGTLVADNFNVMQSLVLFAAATMAGAQHAEGAIFGGLFVAVVPELLSRINLPQDVGSVAFAIGATQALRMGASQSAALRAVLRRRSLRRHSVSRASVRLSLGASLDAAPRASPLLGCDPSPALEVRDLTVRYGHLVALDHVQFRLEPGTVTGLIGPNGAGKSTLIDAATGFLESYEGTILLGRRSLDGLAAHHRARAGVRRTWQQTRIAPELTVGGFVRLAAGHRLPTAELEEILDWFGCPGRDESIAAVDAGTRRLLDVAGAVAGRPRAIFLDEPAAGQSYEETRLLAARIVDIPARFGSAVVLVEHDIDLVRLTCSTVTVLDFGQVIASGSTESVLASEAVVKAYLGTAEVGIP